MKRDLKFRAWDIKGKKMLSHKEINGHWLMSNDFDFFIPMQYTGLKDYKGNDIYEGDILNGRNRILKIVYWCEKRAAFCESEQFKPTPAKHSFAKLYDKFGKVFNKNGTLGNHYIVGNIYENPELLQAEKAQLSEPKVE